MKAILLASITLYVSSLVTLSANDGKKTKLEQATFRSTLIVEAEVISSSPVGHGSESIQVSHRIRFTDTIKGTSSKKEIWVHYTSSRTSPRLGSDYETSLRPKDRRIFLLLGKKANDWTLLRVEPVASRKKILSYIRPKSEQGGADQPATAPESKPEDKEKPKPEAKVRPQ